MALRTINIADFTGGRVTKVSSPMLADNESRDQSNTWCENNALVKRRGWVAINPDIPNTNVNIIKMVLTNLGANGANRLVIFANDGALPYPHSYLYYTDNGTSFHYCETTPTMLSGSSVPFMAMFGGYLYVSDGVHTVLRYDGTNVTTVPAFPKYTKCAVHKNYIFAAKGSTIYWSELKDPTTWPSNNFQSINSDDGDIIIALKSWGGNLIIFKKRSMWVLIGETFDPLEAQYYVQRIDVPSNFTFLFSQTICIHNGIMKFLTVDGFYAYTGGNSIIKISDAIQPDIDKMDTINTYDLATEVEYPAKFPKSFIWKNSMYTSILESNLRRIIVQDEKNKWWKFIDNYWAGNPLEAISCDLGSGEKLYGGLPGMNWFLTMDTGYTIGWVNYPYPIEAYWTSKDFNLSNEAQFLYADIYLKKQTPVNGLGTLVFKVSIDGGSFINFNIDMTNGVGDILKKRVPIMRIGRSIKIQLYNNELGVSFEIYRVVITYEYTDAMR